VKFHPTILGCLLFAGLALAQGGEEKGPPAQLLGGGAQENPLPPPPPPRPATAEVVLRTNWDRDERGRLRLSLSAQGAPGTPFVVLAGTRAGHVRLVTTGRIGAESSWTFSRTFPQRFWAALAQVEFKAVTP